MREFRPPERRAMLRIVVTAVLAIVTLVPVLFLARVVLGSMAASYTIAAGELHVDSGSFLDGERRVPLVLLGDARIVTPHGGRRTRGSYLPGYCAGIWTYPELGEVWQATDCSSPAVRIEARGEDRPIVITPPDPEDFVRRLAARTDTRVELRPADTSVLRSVLAIVTAISVSLSVLLVVLGILAPSRMRYRVSDGTLELVTMFSRRTLAAPSLRAKRYHPRVGLRMAGTALPGYYTGLYREGGATTRLYATDLERGVLVEGPIRAYLSPEDRDGFLAALRTAGGRVEDDGPS